MPPLQPAPTVTRQSSSQARHYIGEYRKLDSIGQGSFATVYRCVHPSGSLVAIKSVSHTKLKGKLKANLYSEIDILKSVKHPHIVALIDILESVNHVHLIMELGWLGDLAMFMKKRDKLDTQPVTAEMARNYPNPPGAGVNEVVVRHFSKQLASALQYLRAKNLVHRDLKPQNLLLSPSPVFINKMKPEERPFKASENSLTPATGVLSMPLLKIADFGFARVLEKTSLAETLCGSPLYMAPEILRYEKYDTKADLWSVGAILYELMAGRPPFRAQNHVDLLAKIEKSSDKKIEFPKSLIAISDDMRFIISGLMKKRPTERISWEDYFNCAVNKDDIPGLVESDRPRKPSSDSIASETESSDRQQRIHGKSRMQFHDPSGRDGGQDVRTGGKAERAFADSGNTGVIHKDQHPGERPVLQNPPGTLMQRQLSNNVSDPITGGQLSPRNRPPLKSHDTAPDAPIQRLERNSISGAVVAMERRNSHNVSDAAISKEVTERDRPLQRRDDRSAKEAREKAIQDVAFERDYVIVEKRAVEVNAFADEMAASPQIQRGQREQVPSPQSGQMVRKASSSGSVNSGGAVDGSKQPPSGRLDSHNRKPSYERRYGPNPNSVTSILGKALNQANVRLFGAGFPLPGLPKGSSPPQTYGAFPQYPLPNSSYSPTSESLGRRMALDEDTRTLQTLEDTATRSDVVFSFAEVKYKQLIPLSPSNGNSLGRGAADGVVEPEDDLTPDAVVTVSEEALVLYVKVLTILAKTIDIAGYWWERRKRSQTGGEPSSLPVRSNSSTTVTSAVGSRINNVVQWSRNRFNECLEKSEYVARKLEDAQKKLPKDHEAHPSNSSESLSVTGANATSGFNIHLPSGITAEKLMYDRANEMSRSAAVDELTGLLGGCEVSYLTALRLLEAVLETDDIDDRKGSASRKDRPRSDSKQESVAINGIDDVDRKSVQEVINFLRLRIRDLKQKIATQEEARRNSPRLQTLSPEPAQQVS